jgi:hypothetical protein
MYRVRLALAQLPEIKMDEAYTLAADQEYLENDVFEFLFRCQGRIGCNEQVSSSD